MQLVIERIIDEFAVNIHCSKFSSPVVNENSMIPTRENDYNKNEQNSFENVCNLFILLLFVFVI